MRKVLKWIAIVIGALLALIVIALVATYFIVENKLNKTYDISPEELDIPSEADAGRREWPLLLIDLCVDCHGPLLRGEVIADDPIFGTIVATNLTSGKGGLGNDYSNADWIRALRHGVDTEGKPLVFMPSLSTSKLSDKDLATLIAYTKNLIKVNNELPSMQVGPLSRLMIVSGLIPDLLAAEDIDHAAIRPPEPVPGVTVAYGEYLSFVCQVCHTEGFSGGSGAGEGMNLTPGGQLADWSEEDFIKTIRTGVAPDGKYLKGQDMPWRTFSSFSDEELKAIWLYLQSLPAVETEHR